MCEKPIHAHIDLNGSPSFTFDGDNVTAMEKSEDYYSDLADQIQKCQKESHEYLKEQSPVRADE